MAYLRHYELTSFVPPNKMPLWVVKICRKRKADKQFHDHKYSEIVFIRNGSCEHLFEGETVPVKAGDLLVVHPGETHAFDKQFEKLEIVNILYDSRRLYLPVLDGSSIPLFRILFPSHPEKVFHSSRPLIHLVPEMRKKISGMADKLDRELKSKQPGHAFYALSIFMEIVVTLGRLYQSNETEVEAGYQIGEILSYMKSHYREQITVPRLAKFSHTSLRNFYIAFQNAAGCSPIQYLIRYRIGLAVELLLHTQFPVSEIADRCGFPDSNYFCKIFHKKMGMSPLCYRRQNGISGGTPVSAALRTSPYLSVK